MLLETSEPIQTTGDIQGGVSIRAATTRGMYKTFTISRQRLISADALEGIETLSEAIFALDYASSLVFKIADDGRRKDMAKRWDYAKLAAKICED